MGAYRGIRRSTAIHHLALTVGPLPYQLWPEMGHGAVASQLPDAGRVRSSFMCGNVAVTSAFKNFPAPHMACREYRMHQVVERCRFPWPEGDGSCRDEFERLDQPHDRPRQVL